MASRCRVWPAGAITTIGVEHGHMRSSTAAALVGAGVLSVLIFPSLASAQRPDSEPVRVGDALEVRQDVADEGLAGG
jgi:hypothetical protein